eukprot:357881-Chlamydomonas_euryale.AAC.27
MRLEAIQIGQADQGSGGVQPQHGLRSLQPAMKGHGGSGGGGPTGERACFWATDWRHVSSSLAHLAAAGRAVALQVAQQRGVQALQLRQPRAAGAARSREPRKRLAPRPCAVRGANHATAMRAAAAVRMRRRRGIGAGRQRGGLPRGRRGQRASVVAVAAAGAAHDAGGSGAGAAAAATNGRPGRDGRAVCAAGKGAAAGRFCAGAHMGVKLSEDCMHSAQPRGSG